MVPKPISNIKGISTTVCPRAILNPASFCFALIDIVEAKSGPGDMTPDAEITITLAANVRKSNI